MKKYLAVVAVLFGALLLTSAPASAQVGIFIGHHGVRVGVGPIYPAYSGYYNNGICGYDYYNRPILCRPAPQPYYYDGCGYDYCGPVYGPGYRGFYDYRGRGGYRGNFGHGGFRGHR